MSIPYGYDIAEVDAPKYMSRGEWDISGTYQIDAWMPLKHVGALTSGLRGVSGTRIVRQWCAPYDDISGLSGCIGVNIRKIFESTNTGLRNQNIGLRKMAILHEGYVFMKYVYGLLDGTVVTLKYGDVLAPTISGFRVYEELNVVEGAGVPVSTGVFLTTGTRQVKLGWYADVVSDATGTRKRIKLIPNSIYGTTK